MRLINIHTRQLEEFLGVNIPPYYILSHTWESDEISFQDYTWLLNYEAGVEEGIIDELLPKQRARIQAKAKSLQDRSGYHKITSFIQLVRSFPSYRGRLPIHFASPLNSTESINMGNLEIDQHLPKNGAQVLGGGQSLLDRIGTTESALSKRVRSFPGHSKVDQAIATDVDYVWIDTCCINKESSAELSEAINSMFKWYGNARVCIVFLSDVDGTDVDGTDVDPRGGFIFLTRWFSRGWTLQELLAPRILLFYNQKWEYITNRSSAEAEIAERKGMRWDQDGKPEMDKSISARMSWAINRETTRVEDQAYCLMGIFGVNMPLLYGEGEQAFYRLQREIISMTADPTIFSWGYDIPPMLSDEKNLHSPSGTCMFARSPAAFQNSHCIEVLDKRQVSFTLTNVGLEMITYLVRPVLAERQGSTFFIVPNVGLKRGSGLLAIPIFGDHVGNIELGNLIDGKLVFRAFGHPVRMPWSIFDKPERRVMRRIVVCRKSRSSIPHFQVPGHRLYEQGLKEHVNLTLRVDESIKLEIHEAWPNSLIFQETPPESIIFIDHCAIIVILRFSDKGSRFREQYALALCLSPNSTNWQAGTSFAYGRVYDWKSFARLGGAGAQESVAGLFCDRPDLTQPENWPASREPTTRYCPRVIHEGVVDDRQHEFLVHLSLAPKQGR